MAIDNAFFEMWRPRALAVLRIVTAYLLIPHGTAKLFGCATPGDVRRAAADVPDRPRRNPGGRGRHLVNKFSRRMNRAIESIPAQAMEALTRHHWPGNVRELQNVIERAVILSTDGVLRVPLPELKSTPRESSAAPRG